MSSQLVTAEQRQTGNGSTWIPPRHLRDTGFHLGCKTDPPGLIEEPAPRSTIVAIHYGPPVRISCRRAGYYHRGLAVHGDIDIIPAGTPSVWEAESNDTYIAMRMPTALLNGVAEEYDFAPGRIEIRNRFQMRDLQLENIGWALKAEMDSGYPCGRLYVDSLAVSVAVRLLRCHSSLSREPKKANGRMSERRLRQVLGYIDDNLSQELLLSDIASVAGLSASHFKTLFRESVGLPVHQYLIRRRVERAKSLLSEGKMSISQIAFETGFAHQSHLARHMRRVLGVSPRTFREMLR